MRVLVACETSGKVREAFRRCGHDAWSCDLLPSDDASAHHVVGDALQVARGSTWDVLIAHPPCTYLSSSGLHWNKRIAGRTELTETALLFVTDLFALPIKYKAIENPIGCISSRVRKPDQIVHPWQFGHDASKATCLWLENLPTLRPTSLVEPRWICCGIEIPAGAGKHGCANCCGDKTARPRWSNQTNSGQNRLGPSDDRWKLRSETYQGIADAMAEQWSLALLFD